MLGGADGDAWRHRRHGLVSEMLVNELRRAPEGVSVDTGILSKPGQ